jgi:glycosyltransferase involved in cell wall biosynthesis
MSTSRPLVTFALFTYNQEAYVAEAVEGALSQDYSPLEIVISDDASTDRTFEIIQGLVRDYRGPHDIRLVRNEVNLGIGAHVTKVAHLARGELIVAAAGDDVSLPPRASAMVALWEAHRRIPDLLCCDAETMDARGMRTGRRPAHKGSRLDATIVARDGRLVHGAVATWTKRMWKIYPELPSECINEDMVLSLRAAMQGGIVRHPAEMVRYRVGTGVSQSPPGADRQRLLDHRRNWAGGLARSLMAQADDARRQGQAILEVHIKRRLRATILIQDLYAGDGMPPLRRWRGGLFRGYIRQIASAIVATRFPSMYLGFRRIQSVLSSRRTNK